MNAYNYYTIDGQQWHLKKCENPECRRLTSALYCCGPCESAFEGKYEIHENGPLGHTESCNQRYEKRKDVPLR